MHITYGNTVPGLYRRGGVVTAGTTASTVKCRLDISVYSEPSVFMRLARAIKGGEKALANT